MAQKTFKENKTDRMKAESTCLSYSEFSRLIDEWIFSERDREILKRRLLDGISYNQLADQFELSVRQIKNIVYKGEDRLFKHI